MGLRQQRIDEFGGVNAAMEAEKRRRQLEQASAAVPAAVAAAPATLYGAHKLAQATAPNANVVTKNPSPGTVTRTTNYPKEVAGRIGEDVRRVATGIRHPLDAARRTTTGTGFVDPKAARNAQLLEVQQGVLDAREAATKTAAKTPAGKAKEATRAGGVTDKFNDDLGKEWVEKSKGMGPAARKAYAKELELKAKEAGHKFNKEQVFGEGPKASAGKIDKKVLYEAVGRPPKGGDYPDTAKFNEANRAWQAKANAYTTANAPKPVTLRGGAAASNLEEALVDANPSMDPEARAAPKTKADDFGSGGRRVGENARAAQGSTTPETPSSTRRPSTVAERVGDIAGTPKVVNKPGLLPRAGRIAGSVLKGVSGIAAEEVARAAPGVAQSALVGGAQSAEELSAGGLSRAQLKQASEDVYLSNAGRADVGGYVEDLAGRAYQGAHNLVRGFGFEGGSVDDAADINSTDPGLRRKAQLRAAQDFENTQLYERRNADRTPEQIAALPVEQQRQIAEQQLFAEAASGTYTGQQGLGNNIPETIGAVGSAYGQRAKDIYSDTKDFFTPEAGGLFDRITGNRLSLAEQQQQQQQSGAPSVTPTLGAGRPAPVPGGVPAAQVPGQTFGQRPGGLQQVGLNAALDPSQYNNQVNPPADMFAAPTTYADAFANARPPGLRTPLNDLADQTPRRGPQVYGPNGLEQQLSPYEGPRGTPYTGDRGDVQTIRGTVVDPGRDATPKQQATHKLDLAIQRLSGEDDPRSQAVLSSMLSERARLSAGYYDPRSTGGGSGGGRNTFQADNIAQFNAMGERGEAAMAMFPEYLPLKGGFDAARNAMSMLAYNDETGWWDKLWGQQEIPMGSPQQMGRSMFGIGTAINSGKADSDGMVQVNLHEPYPHEVRSGRVRKPKYVNMNLKDLDLRAQNSILEMTMRLDPTAGLFDPATVLSQSRERGLGQSLSPQ